MRNKHNSAQKSAKLWSFVLSTSFVLSSLVIADEVQDLDKEVSQIDKVAKEQSADSDELKTVSKATGVPVAELQKQQTKTKMGPGSLFIANSLSDKSGKSFEDIVAAKKSGKGWGQLAKEHNLKLGPLLKEAKQLNRVQRENASAKKKSSKSAEGSQNSKSKGNGSKNKKSSNNGKGGGKNGKGGSKGKK